jgi:hypothetical protein
MPAAVQGGNGIGAAGGGFYRQAPRLGQRRMAVASVHSLSGSRFVSSAGKRGCLRSVSASFARALSAINEFNSVTSSSSRLPLIQAKALGGLALLREAKREVGHFLQGRR